MEMRLEKEQDIKGRTTSLEKQVRKEVSSNKNREGIVLTLILMPSLRGFSQWAVTAVIPTDQDTGRLS